MKTPIVCRCHRCGQNTQCTTFHDSQGTISLCTECVRLLALEYARRFAEYTDLVNG